MNASSTAETLSVLKEKLELLDSADQLSIGDALELVNEIVKLAQGAASSLEAGGELAEAAALYGDVAEALEEASEKVPEKARGLLTPLTDFWSVTAKLKRDSLPIVSETEETEALLPRWERHISVKTQLPQQLSAAVRERGGKAVVRNSLLSEKLSAALRGKGGTVIVRRNSFLSEQLDAVLRGKEGKAIGHRSPLDVGKKGITFKRDLGKG